LLGWRDSLSIADTVADGIASLARTQGVETGMHAVSGTVADQIAAVTEEQRAELIVVGNRGMGGVKRIPGSIPNAAAPAAPRAVLIHNTTCQAPLRLSRPPPRLEWERMRGLRQPSGARRTSDSTQTQWPEVMLCWSRRTLLTTTAPA